MIEIYEIGNEFIFSDKKIIFLISITILVIHLEIKIKVILTIKYKFQSIKQRINVKRTCEASVGQFLLLYDFIVGEYYFSTSVHLFLLLFFPCLFFSLSCFRVSTWVLAGVILLLLFWSEWKVFVIYLSNCHLPLCTRNTLHFKSP